MTYGEICEEAYINVIESEGSCNGIEFDYLLDREVERLCELYEVYDDWIWLYGNINSSKG